MQDVIRMTYDVALCHLDEITKIWSLSHPDDLVIPSISSGWLIVDALYHPDDLPAVGISSGWVTANSLCHPDDKLFHFMSSGWLNWGWFLIRMSYGNVIMSSGWDSKFLFSTPRGGPSALPYFRTFLVVTRYYFVITSKKWTISFLERIIRFGLVTSYITVAAWAMFILWKHVITCPWPWYLLLYDDVIKWKHFPRYWPFVRGIHRSPVNSRHKCQWRGALMFFLSAPEQTVE